MYLTYVVGGFLIYEIVEPVAEEQIGVTAPTHHRTLLGIIVPVVVCRNLGVHAFGEVAVIFKVKCPG